MVLYIMSCCLIHLISSVFLLVCHLFLVRKYKTLFLQLIVSYQDTGWFYWCYIVLNASICQPVKDYRKASSKESGDTSHNWCACLKVDVHVWKLMCMFESFAAFWTLAQAGGPITKTLITSKIWFHLKYLCSYWVNIYVTSWEGSPLHLRRFRE